MKYSKRVGVAAAAVGLGVLSACSSGGGSASGQGGDSKTAKVFLDLSTSGNNWQDEAANLAEAVAKSPTYKSKVSFTKQISGTHVQDQISDIQSMIASGAKLIVLYPVSPTALDPVITQGCKQGVIFVAYDSTVHAPCAYNVAYITGARPGTNDAFFGAQTARALVKMLDGHGNIFMNRGVAGTSTDDVHAETAKAVFKKHPGIHIKDTYYSNWNSSLSQQNTAKALAAHPNVDGIWSEDGEAGVIKALKAKGMKIPVTGESSNYTVEQLSKGWPGVASGSPVAQGGIAMKVGLHLLFNGTKGIPKNIEVPLPWTTTKSAKPCPGSKVVNGCNFFPKQPSLFVTLFSEPKLLPESNIAAAKTGKPFPKVDPLPADMKKFAQPESRRIYTRGKCDDGYKEGIVKSGQSPAGLKGCVKE